MASPKIYLPQGLITVNSEAGKLLGFVADVFTSGSELFRRGNCIYIQAIEVVMHKRKQGNFYALQERLLDYGYIVKVPNPTTKMQRTLEKIGYQRIDEISIVPGDGTLEVMMMKEPK